jgi:uncharacterized repeat protein (TIGR02543 family)
MLTALLAIALLFSSTFTAITNNYTPFVSALEMENGSIHVNENFKVDVIDEKVVDETELCNAVNDAVGPTVIALTTNIVLTSSLNIPVGKEITLVSYGSGEFYQLIGASTMSTIEVFGEVTLFNITVTHNAISKDSHGVMILGGTCIMVGGEISGNNATKGGGVYVSGSGVFSMFGGKISGNKADQGGGVYNDNSECNISDNAVIASNTARIGGGVFNTGSNAMFTMSGGEIAYNEAISGSESGNGGGVYNSNSTFTMSGGEIVYNKCGSSGGGVYNINGIVNMDTGAILSNNAIYGGGVYNYGYSGSGASFTMSGGIISGNEVRYGGGVYNTGSRSTFTLTGGEISGNKATLGSTSTSGFGGGVYNDGTVIMNGGKISGNTANFGGGVFNYFGTYTMSGNSIITNNNITLGQHSGGGVYNYGYFTMQDNAEISNNSAPWGGGIFNEYNTFTMKGGTITGNTATVGNGGAIYANNVQDSNAKIIITGGTISNNTTPSYGGGIYIHYTHLNKLTIEAGVTFSDNNAKGLYSRNQADDTLYNAQISPDVTWTKPATQGYNNYDISYTNGELITFHTVTVHDSYAPNTGAGSYTAGETVTVNAGTRAGYIFTDWTVNSGGVTLEKNPTVTFTMPANAVTITANWEKIEDPEIPSYTVTYNGNGHTSGSAPIDNNSPYLEGNLVTVLNQGNIVKTGYSFLGWSTSSTANTATFTAGDTFTIHNDITLYAVWKENTYTVTYQPGTHGTFEEQITSGLHYGDPTPAAPTVTGDAGWTFTGWTPVPTTTVTDNAIYIAQWTQTTTTPSVTPPTTTAPPTTTETPPPLTPTPTVPPSMDSGNNSIQVWALVNLVLSIVGVVLFIIVTLYALLQRKEKNKQQLAQKKQGNRYANINGQHTENRDGDQAVEKKQRQQRHIWLAIAIIAGIAGVIVFLLTEDMNNVMVMTDKWTIINVIIFIVEIIAITFTFKHKKDNSNNKEQEQS